MDGAPPPLRMSRAHRVRLFQPQHGTSGRPLPEPLAQQKFLTVKIRTVETRP
jgi:hypothetical protein